MKDVSSYDDSVNHRSFLTTSYFSLFFEYLPVIARRLLIGWFAFSPLISFYFRYPAERSLITFDRAVLIFIAGLLLFNWYRETPKDERFKNIAASRFELAWLGLTVIALSSAIAMSNNFGTATKIAIDSFLLPLIMFRLARYHIELKDDHRLLMLGAIFLGFVLFITGAYEMMTGNNLFAYSGSDIVREGEIRVNGPFSSDSSYAGISLLLLLFLLAAPKLLKVRIDISAQFLYLCSLIAVLTASLLPVFRTVALALAVCWAGYEVLRRRGRGFNADSHISSSGESRTMTNRPLVLAGLALITALGFSVIFISLLSGERLASLYNVYGRLATWNAAVSIVTENPLTGVGLNNYRDYIDQKYQTEDQLEDAVGEIRAARSPHSNLLWVAAELGIVGIALYLAANLFIFLLGYRMLRDSRTIRQQTASACYLAIAAAYTIVGLTLTSGAYSDLNLYFFFLLGVTSKEFQIAS